MAYMNGYYGGYFPQQNFQNANAPEPYTKGQFKPYPFNQPLNQPQMIPTQTNDMLWVLGEVEATSYPVAPNNVVTLWDKNEPTIYIKSVNAQGVPSMRILDFTERNSNPAPKQEEKHVCTCGKNYVSIQAFEALQAKFEELNAKFESIVNIPNTNENEGE